jgi:tripartite-type tricarboxylate transporter receptor subunit TctC
LEPPSSPGWPWGLAPLAPAQPAYPHSRVTLVTHSSPGGGSDVFLRELARHLGPTLGVNFAVENVTGGSGAKAMALVARGKPDGSVFYATTPTYIQTTLLARPTWATPRWSRWPSCSRTRR